MTSNANSEKPDVSFDAEGVIKYLGPALPKDLLKELEEATKKKDEASIDLIMNDKVRPTLAEYNKKVMNFQMNEGEQILWSHRVARGIIHKEPMEDWVVTNMRAFKFYPVSKENPKARIASVGLVIAETVVMNQSRKSKGSRVGTFAGVAHGSFAGSSVGFSSSTSQTYGDLVFFVAGKEAFRFQGISDPQGLRRLIQTLKKQISL